MSGFIVGINLYPIAFVFAVFIVMIIIIILRAGWLKGLVFLGSFAVTLFLFNIIIAMTATGKEYVMAFNVLFIGLWVFGMVLYSVLKGYIPNIGVDPFT